MKEFDAYNAITRRGLRIHYVSPLICMLPSISSGSGSSSEVLATLDIAPVNRLAGPASLSAEGNLLTWSTQPYIFSYVVYYSVSVNGPFLMLTSNVQNDQFLVSGIAPGNYFFKVTGIEPTAGETLPSPTIGPVIIT
jgi:hypothetical protein